MSDRLDGIRRKADRAKQHISDLNARIGTFCDNHPYEIGAKPHRVPEIDHTTLYVTRVDPIPDPIPLIIGDAIHNLRSSLDHLAWQLVDAGGGTPNRDTYFPICSDPQGKQKFATAIGKGEIKRIPLGSEKLLLAVQPYVSGDETLWHIHELDRIDKHRLLITAVAGFNEWRVDAGYGQGPRFPQSATVPLEVGYEIVNIPTSTYHRESHDNFKLKTDIAFGQSEIVGGKSILETLNKMAIVVDDIITRFEPYLL